MMAVIALDKDFEGSFGAYGAVERRLGSFGGGGGHGEARREGCSVGDRWEVPLEV